MYAGSRNNPRRNPTMDELLFHNATLIDGTGADPRSRTSVLVENGLIRQIGPAENITPPRDGRVIDLNGLTLMPMLKSQQDLR